MKLGRRGAWTMAAMLLAASCCGARAADDLPAPAYVIKQDTPDTGTRIPRKLVTGSLIPLNRRYADLTADEQRAVRSQYETMAAGDEPPFPIDGLSPIFAVVSKVQKKLLAQGALSMDVEIDSHGDASSVRVVQSPDAELTRAVASILMLTKYKPAVCGGRPCQMAFPFRLTFHVEH
jgi:hypothetical protein